MSFSSEVKKELLAVEAKSRHCQLAELSAMLSGSGEVSVQNGQVQVSFVTENQQAVARYTRQAASPWNLRRRAAHTAWICGKRGQ